MPTSEEIEDCMANSFNQWLVQQPGTYLTHLLVCEANESNKLEPEERKLIIKMITERNFTGKNIPGFEDERSRV